MLTLKLITAPAAEPVLYTEASNHLRLSSTADQAYVESLITAARVAIESYTRRALITQSWRLTLDEWPKSHTLTLPRAPVQTITSVTLDGAVTISSSHYSLHGDKLLLRVTPPAPSDIIGGITIDYTAGYGNTSSSVPAAIRQSLLVILANWYENRDGYRDTLLPPVALSLLQPYRLICLA